MLRHVWSVLCASSVIDKDTNNISLFDVREEVKIEISSDSKRGKNAKPKNINPLVFEWITLWARSLYGKPMTGIVKDTVLSPSGKIILDSGEYNIDLTKHERMRYKRRMSSISTEETGQYNFNTEVKDETRNEWVSVSSVPLIVTIIDNRSK